MEPAKIENFVRHLFSWRLRGHVFEHVCLGTLELRRFEKSFLLFLQIILLCIGVISTGHQQVLMSLWSEFGKSICQSMGESNRNMMFSFNFFDRYLLKLQSNLFLMCCIWHDVWRNSASQVFNSGSNLRPISIFWNMDWSVAKFWNGRSANIAIKSHD